MKLPRKSRGYLAAFINFVQERHRVFERRHAGEPRPWSADPVLHGNKFTNVFRVADYGSQFVFGLFQDGIRDNLPAREVAAQVFLYRHTNNPSPWREYRAEVGHWPRLDEYERLKRFFDAYALAGGKVFSGAYNINPPSREKGTRKAPLVVQLAWNLFHPDSEWCLWDDFSAHNDDLEGQFEVIVQARGINNFMGMQILTDWGWSPWVGVDRENDFIAGGPGATRGAQYIFPGLKPAQVPAAITELRNIILDQPEVPTLRVGTVARVPSLMDIQNCCCEFSKYVRFVGKWTGALKSYSVAHPSPPARLYVPDHWN